MKIAMIGQKGLPATCGGVEHVVEELGAELVSQGHEVTVFCRESYSGSDATPYRGMQREIVSAVRTKHLEALSHSALCAKRAVAMDFDIVHFHALGPGLFSPVTKYLSNARVVQTIHGLDDRRQKWGLAARSSLRLGGAFSTRVPDATIVLTEDLRRFYRWQRQADVVTIPNGVRRPVVPIDWEDRVRRLGLVPGSYAVTVGRLVPEKAVHQLVQTFSRSSSELDLVVVGDSSHTDSYAQQVRTIAPHDPRISLVGARHGDDLAALYHGAAYFVTASLLEGMPLVVLEAMSHGLPILASDIAPHREILGHASPGRALFRAGDNRSLRIAIESMTTGLEARRVDAVTRAAAQIDGLSWTEVARQTASVYERVLAGVGVTNDPQLVEVEANPLRHKHLLLAAEEAPAEPVEVEALSLRLVSGGR